MLRASFLMLLFSFGRLFAQNLVPNPSFECGTFHCDCTYDSYLIESLQVACHWSLPTHGTSDFFSTDIPNQDCWTHMPPLGEYYDQTVPHLGSQLPRTGNRFAGLFTYGTGFNPTFQKDTADREYLQVELIEPLIPGKYYCGEMFVSLAEQPRYASNNLGMCFYGEKLMFYNFHSIPYTPQIVEKEIILNSESWTRIYGSFKADSAVQYLGIGNFFQNDQTLIKDKGGTHPQARSYTHAYYFIDDISVTKMDVGPFVHASSNIICSGRDVQLRAEGKLENIVWTTLADTTKIIGTGSSVHLVPETTTTYRVSATTCKLKVVDTITVKVNAAPEFYLGNDTTICKGASLKLLARAGFVGYEWQDKSNSNSFTVREAGIYSLSVENEFGCKRERSIRIGIAPEPHVDLGNDTLLCNKLFFPLRPGNGYDDYLWSTGSTDSTYTPSFAGEFWVRVGNQCGEDSDTIKIQSFDDLFIPNVLTINNDTLNRHFTIKGLPSEMFGALTVYNRWGQQIYQDHQYKNDWPADPDRIPAETYYFTWANGSCPVRKGWLKILK